MTKSKYPPVKRQRRLDGKIYTVVSTSKIGIPKYATGDIEHAKNFAKKYGCKHVRVIKRKNDVVVYARP